MGIDAKRIDEPLSSQVGFLITQQEVSHRAIGHHPLPSCAASADASQPDMLLCQCRILKKGRRHRDEAGPVGNQEISCSAPGPCKCPLTTGSGRQAGRPVASVVRFQTLTDWLLPGTHLTATTTAQHQVKVEEGGIGLIRR